MSKVTRTILINAPRDKVFDVVSDFESYPEFLTETKDVTIEKKGKTEVVASFTLQLITKINYTLKLRLSKPSGISWTLVRGQMMSRNSGSWKLKSLPRGKTEAAYSIDVAFGLLVPKSISNMLVETNLPKMLECFKERAEAS